MLNQLNNFSRNAFDTGNVFKQIQVRNLVLTLHAHYIHKMEITVAMAGQAGLFPAFSTYAEILKLKTSGSQEMAAIYS